VIAPAPHEQGSRRQAFCSDGRPSPRIKAPVLAPRQPSCAGPVLIPTGRTTETSNRNTTDRVLRVSQAVRHAVLECPGFARLRRLSDVSNRREADMYCAVNAAVERKAALRRTLEAHARERLLGAQSLSYEAARGCAWPSAIALGRAG
jgi:hypothetical protein